MKKRPLMSVMGSTVYALCKNKDPKKAEKDVKTVRQSKEGRED